MLNYITVTPDFTYAVSNVETYVVAFNYEPSDSEVASFVYQNKGNDFDYSIISVDPVTLAPVNILQRHTNTGAVEHVTGSDTHLYLVSLIDGVSDARNETMKQVLKI
jgi:hypothetical protein